MSDDHHEEIARRIRAREARDRKENERREKKRTLARNDEEESWARAMQSLEGSLRHILPNGSSVLLSSTVGTNREYTFTLYVGDIRPIPFKLGDIDHWPMRYTQPIRFHVSAKKGSWPRETIRGNAVDTTDTYGTMTWRITLCDGTMTRSHSVGRYTRDGTDFLKALQQYKDTYEELIVEQCMHLKRHGRRELIPMAKLSLAVLAVPPLLLLVYILFSYLQ